MSSLSTWILVANSAEAFLYSSDNLRTGNLTLVRQFTHPESRMKASDLVSDGRGGFPADTGGNTHGGCSHGSYDSNDPKKVEAEVFVLSLAKEIHTFCGEHNRCEKLVIVAPTHFCGLMKKHLDAHITDLTYIPKDYTKYTSGELLKVLREHLFFE